MQILFVEPLSPRKKIKVVSSKPSINIPQMVTFFNKAHEVIGWMFEGFYDGHEYLTKLSTKNGSVTVIGEMEFKAFSNLKTKWMPECMLGDHLWVILIEYHDRSDVR